MSSIRIIIRTVPMISMEILKKVCEQYGKVYKDSYTSKEYVVVRNQILMRRLMTLLKKRSWHIITQQVKLIFTNIGNPIKDPLGKKIELKIELEYSKIERTPAKKILSKEEITKKRESPRRSFSRSRSRSRSSSPPNK